MSVPNQFDLAIIGAGPSGSTLALLMARYGWRVVLLEKKKMPRDKVCGGFIGPANHDLLEELGLLDRMRQEGFPLLKSLLLSVPKDRSIEIPLVLKGKATTSWGVWRREFDELLMQEARKAGVLVLENVSLDRIEKEQANRLFYSGPAGSSGSIEATVVVNASGADPEQMKGPFHAMGLAAEFENANVPESQVSVHYAPDGHCGIDPIGKGRITVGYVADPVLFERGQKNPDVILGIFRKQNLCLDRLIGSGKQITPWKGTRIYLVSKFRFWEDGMFHVGDAVGNVNPVGGVGLTFAFQSAKLLAGLLKRDPVSEFPFGKVARDYERLWRRELLGRLQMSRFLGRLSHGPFAAGLMMDVFQSFPGLLKFAFQKQHAFVRSNLDPQHFIPMSQTR